MKQRIEPKFRLPNMTDLIQQAGDSARSIYVHAYFEEHHELFGVKPYANLDFIAPNTVRRGDYWASKIIPLPKLSENGHNMATKESRVYLVIEIEYDVQDFEIHAHHIDPPGVIREHDIATVDMLIAATDKNDNADRLREKYGIPVYVIEDMPYAPSFTDFKRKCGWGC